MNEFNFHPLFADPWKPSEKGEIITGTIFEVGEKFLRKDAVPYVILVNPDGEMREILLGGAALRTLYLTGELQEDRQLSIRYDGESDAIENAGNFMKMFSFCLCDENGAEINIVQALKEVKGGVESGGADSKPHGSSLDGIPSAATQIESQVRGK